MKIDKKIKLAIYFLFFSILLVLLFFWIYFAKAWGRDHQRIADLKIIQENFNYYHVKNGTFVVGGCRLDEDISNCFIKMPFTLIFDPLDDEVNRYIVRKLYQDDYEVEFSLEVGFNGLDAGRYILTKDGIRR